MNKYEADKLLKRMQAVFTFHNFGDDGVKVEWMKSIGNLDFNKCDKLIDLYKKNDSKSLPPISAFIQEYMRYENRTREVVNCDCPKCGGKGYITYLRQYEYKNRMQQTQTYIAYCDCAAGEQYKYNGTQLSDKNYKSSYHILSAAELNLVEEKLPNISGIDEIKRQVSRLLGIKLNICQKIKQKEGGTLPPWEQ